MIKNLSGVYRRGRRPNNPNYGPNDYVGEFALVVNAISQNPNVTPLKNLIGPSVTSVFWTPEQIWQTPFLSEFANSLGALSVQQ